MKDTRSKTAASAIQQLDPETARLLSQITLLNVRTQQTAQGVSWSAMLCERGVPVLSVSQLGYGGSNRYWPPTESETGNSARLKDHERFSQAREVERRLEMLARRATGLQAEALDVLTSAMDDGDDAVTGLIRWREYRNGS